jgi:streptomycin 6-kinase
VSGWPASIEQELRAAMGRWGLETDGPARETPSGCIAFVRQHGEPRALKIFAPNSDETNAAAVLAHYGSHGAVRVLGHSAHALLLERVEPGLSLTGRVIAGDDDGATAILCAVMQALHRGPPPGGRFPSVEDWGEGFARFRERGGPLPPLLPLVERAEALYDELARSQGARCLLHGDLHHYNVLHDAKRGWLAIDPKGVTGELAYETGALLRNPCEDASLFATPAVIDRRVRILCERLPLDRARVLGWCFAQAVLSAIWAVEDGVEDKQGLITAEATLPLL